VLVTSRHTLVGLGARLFDVAVLDEQASLELLNAALRTARPEDDRITRDAEYIPPGVEERAGLYRSVLAGGRRAGAGDRQLSQGFRLRVSARR